MGVAQGWPPGRRSKGLGRESDELGTAGGPTNRRPSVRRAGDVRADEACPAGPRQGREKGGGDSCPVSSRRRAHGVDACVQPKRSSEGPSKVSRTTSERRGVWAWWVGRVDSGEDEQGRRRSVSATVVDGCTPLPAPRRPRRSSPRWLGQYRRRRRTAGSSSVERRVRTRSSSARSTCRRRRAPVVGSTGSGRRPRAPDRPSPARTSAKQSHRLDDKRGVTRGSRSAMPGVVSSGEGGRREQRR